jgi:hypothetical protein
MAFYLPLALLMCESQDSYPPEKKLLVITNDYHTDSQRNGK